MLETAVAAAQAAGHLLCERFSQPHEVSSKGLRDLVTEADVLAQGIIISAIRARYPEHAILSEEAATATSRTSSRLRHHQRSPEQVQDNVAARGEAAVYQWYVDPLDGTTNYARGIPFFAISIAVACHGALQVGVVYEPLSGRLFHAVAGKGAYLNGQRLHVSERTQLIEALLDLGWARSQPARLACVQAAQALGPYIGSARTFGSAALGLAAVAAGWEDIYYHPELAPWDVAAGILLVREAGGVVTTPQGQPYDLCGGRFLATNGLLHDLVLERLSTEGKM